MSDAKKQYDNAGQYSRSSILRYEKIFGPGYISTGGQDTTDRLCRLLGSALKPGIRVLDVGSGIGGAAFFLANAHGARVLGVDLAPEMIAIAHDATPNSGAADKVEFVLGDIFEVPREGGFDVVWSRDALMHIPDKPRLFGRLFELTKPGGNLVITDYARGVGTRSPEFEAYVAKTGYHVTDPASYGRLLEDAGFVDVVAHDATADFIAILKDETERLRRNRSEFLGTFSEDDLRYLVERWEMKVGFCERGDMKWGVFSGRRPV